MIIWGLFEILVSLSSVGDVASIYDYFPGYPIFSFLTLSATPHLPQTLRIWQNFHVLLALHFALVAVLYILIVILPKVVIQNFSHECLLLFLVLAKQKELLVELSLFELGVVWITTQIRILCVDCKIAASFVEI